MLYYSNCKNEFAYEILNIISEYYLEENYYYRHKLKKSLWRAIMWCLTDLERPNKNQWKFVMDFVCRHSIRKNLIILVNDVWIRSHNCPKKYLIPLSFSRIES